jgi:hypothetical protein
LSDHAAAEFAALRMDGDPLAHGVDRAFLVGRPAETDKRLIALASAEGVDAIVTGGLPECARSEVHVPIPFTAVESIVDWIDRSVPTHTHCATPRYLTTATMPAEGNDGADVLESIERIEPNGLFAIRTRSPDHSLAPAKTVLFFVTGQHTHVGPAREWVELSRRVAAAGSPAVRWDPAGQGMSGEISRDPWRRIFSKADIADSIAVARHACQDASELQLVGVCSGAWYAAQVARNIGARSAILVNLVVWNWRIIPTTLQQWDYRKRTLHANAACDTDGNPSEFKATTRIKALINAAREPTKSLMHNRLPQYVLQLLRWVGLVYRPEDVLRTLAHGGTAVTVIASPEDAQSFMAKGGGAALQRLQKTSRPPRMIATPAGDHAAYHSAILAAIRNAVLPEAASAPSERIPAWDITSIGSHRVRQV